METSRKIFQVERKDINYIRTTIESYDGSGVVRTVDPHRALIEVTIAPGCEELISELVFSLVNKEGLIIRAI